MRRTNSRSRPLRLSLACSRISTQPCSKVSCILLDGPGGPRRTTRTRPLFRGNVRFSCDCDTASVIRDLVAPGCSWLQWAARRLSTAIGPGQHAKNRADPLASCGAPEATGPRSYTQAGWLEYRHYTLSSRPTRRARSRFRLRPGQESSAPWGREDGGRARTTGMVSQSAYGVADVLAAGAFGPELPRSTPAGHAGDPGAAPVSYSAYSLASPRPGAGKYRQRTGSCPRSGHDMATAGNDRRTHRRGRPGQPIPAVNLPSACRTCEQP